MDPDQQQASGQDSTGGRRPVRGGRLSLINAVFSRLGFTSEQKVITVGLIFLMFVLIKAYTARGTHARREYRRAQQEKQRWARHQQQRKAKAAREKKSTA